MFFRLTLSSRSDWLANIIADWLLMVTWQLVQCDVALVKSWIHLSGSIESDRMQSWNHDNWHRSFLFVLYSCSTWSATDGSFDKISFVVIELSPSVDVHVQCSARVVPRPWQSIPVHFVVSDYSRCSKCAAFRDRGPRVEKKRTQRHPVSTRGTTSMYCRASYYICLHVCMHAEVN